jgi:hypothetical protein
MKTEPQKIKNYIGISRDHSASMAHLTRAALADYNETINFLHNTSEDLETYISVVNCGTNRQPTVSVDESNTFIKFVKPLTNYPAAAMGTPLFDSVGQLISMFENCPDANNPNVSFLVMAITDGEENASRLWSSYNLANKIKELQKTDRWTFVFRVPRGYKQALVRFGIHEGNIFEWDQTERGVREATTATQTAFTEYYTGLKTGVKSTTKFYTNLNEVSIADIKKSLVDISKDIQIWHVDTEAEGKNIRNYCEHKLGKPMKKGAAFYELTKPEREVQDYKKIVIRNKSTREFFSGNHARDLLGLPHYGTCKVVPGDHGDYEIFIQSTSVNRKLPVGTTLVYWENFDRV